MKVLLVKPYNLSDHIQPPLGLGYLATAIRDKCNVALLDCIKERITKPEALLTIIKKYKPDVLGMQCYTFHVNFVKETFRLVKGFNKDIICVSGGPHLSAVPHEAMQQFYPFIDFGFQGESEIGLPLLINELIKGKVTPGNIPGLLWMEDGIVRANSPALADNLDTLGFPAWDLLRPDTYPESQHGAFYRKFPIAPIIVTRGCPYHCTFCAANKIAGRKLRKHSIAYVLEQMQLLYHTYGIREFHIIDDNFTFDVTYAKSLLNGMMKLNLDISWATPNGIRLDRIDDELLGLMKQSGLYLISLGIESGSDRILKIMRKGTTVAGIRKSVKMINKSGIDVAGFFILGFPGETKDDIEKTISLACELDLVRANFFTYLPFPATDSFNELKANGGLDNVDWDNFYFMSAPYVPATMTRKELKRFQRKAFFRLFFRPKIFIKNILQIKSFQHLKYLFLRLYHWIIKS